MHPVAALLILASLASAETVSGNFPRDLYGPVDTRDTRSLCAGGPCIWGHADADALTITFNPPPGFKVRILALRGDLTAWIKSLPGDAATPLESAAGVLMGIQGTASNGSSDCNYCAANSPVYVQDAVTEKQPKTVRAFDYEDVDMLLGADNAIVIKLAAWLNTTGKPIHLEGTYTVKFAYEPI